MNIDYQLFIPKDFSENTRIWIYQSNRKFTADEASTIQYHLNSFCKNWMSHGAKVRAHGLLLHDFFLVLMADEVEMTVSGCSIDSTVRFVKELETTFKVSFFDRTALAFLINGEVKLTPFSELNNEFKAGKLAAHTLFFDNTVQRLPDFKDKWLIPLSSSWLVKRLNVNIPE